MAGFTKDWFRRKKENAYSFYDKSKKSFSWEDGINLSNGYSSYFVKDNENLKSAAKMVGSMFKVVGVPKGMKMESKINTKNSSDDVKVPVPLSMLKDKETGEYLNKDTELLDAFYGASIQNAALATMQSKSEYIRTMNARSTSEGKTTTPQDLLYSILNTERIDKKLADRFPGYSKFVQKYKQYKYDKTYEPLAPEEHQGKRLLELITKFLRYPEHITDEELEEFKDPIEQIEKYVHKNGFPSTSQECERQSAYMYNVVQKYIQEEEKKPEEEGGGKGPSGDEMNDMAQSLMKSMVNSDDGDESDEAASDFSDFADDMEDKNSTPKSIDYSQKGENQIIGNVKFIKGSSNKERYQKDLNKIDTVKAHVLAKLFTRKCKDYRFSMKSMRSGRLDTNKIAEAKQNVPTIYERFGEVKTNKVNIAVLIDESGSMGGDKIEKARQASIFINEVFKNIPDARLYIYGHTADGGGGGGLSVSYGDCVIRIYTEHGKHSDPYALGSVAARHNNRDGDAIYAVARRVRSQNQDPCLLFVISDGSPHAHEYYGQEAIEDTRKKVTQSEALDFQVIQIAIENSVPSEEMFNHYIKMTDIKNLPNEMIAYISKRVDKLIKTKTTM
jgi:hypothetical protein